MAAKNKQTKKNTKSKKQKRQNTPLISKTNKNTTPTNDSKK